MMHENNNVAIATADRLIMRFDPLHCNTAKILYKRFYETALWEKSFCGSRKHVFLIFHFFYVSVQAAELLIFTEAINGFKNRAGGHK